MENLAIGKKIGMTRIFNENGKSIAVTVVKVESNVVTQIKDNPSGTKNVQIASIKAKKLNKPETGHLKKAKQDLYKTLKEFRTEKEYKIGDQITVESFEEGDTVTISGISKGKGFAGVIKRHNFSRGPETHGSDHHRKPGSIGSMFPQHVLKGQKMPGHMGHEKVTVRNLKIHGIDKQDNLLLVSGAVPGSNGSVVYISK